MKVEDMETANIEICRGVRQGCVVSPVLFILYSEMVFKEAVNSEIGGQAIDNIYFSDNTAAPTESQTTWSVHYKK